MYNKIICIKKNEETLMQSHESKQYILDIHIQEILKVQNEMETNLKTLF